jgi:hypothetical protein
MDSHRLRGEACRVVVLTHAGNEDGACDESRDAAAARTAVQVTSEQKRRGRTTTWSGIGACSQVKDQPRGSSVVFQK